MKQFRLILFILSLGAALRVFAAAGDAWFLTSQEFNRLTPREQKEYIREIQKVIGSLAERSEHFASVAKPARSIASEAEARLNSEQVEIALKEATQWRGDEIPAYQYYHPKKADQFREDVKNAMEWTIATRVGVTYLPEDDPKRADLEKKVAKLEKYFLDRRDAFKKSFDKDDSLNNTFERMTSARDGETDPAAVVSPQLTFHGDRQTVTLNLRKPAGAPSADPNLAQRLPQPPGPATGTSLPAKGNIEAPGVPPPKPKPPMTAAVPPPPATVAPGEAARDPALIGYRCMYAGSS